MKKISNFLIILFALFLYNKTQAQEHTDFDVLAKELSNWCGCNVPIYNSIDDYNHGTPSQMYYNGQETYNRNWPGSSFCNGPECFMQTTGRTFNVSNNAGHQNDPINKPPNAPCYSCSCDPIFCVGGNPTNPTDPLTQPKDYSDYTPPCQNPECDPYYWTWTWDLPVADNNPSVLGNIASDPLISNGYGVYFGVYFDQKWAFSKNNVVYPNNIQQINTQISPPCNFLQQGSSGMRVNGDCYKVWSYSFVDGKWYYFEDNDWKLFVPSIKIIEAYTADKIMLWFRDHPLETAQLYESMMKGKDFGLIAPNAVSLTLESMVMEEFIMEYTALQIINIRKYGGRQPQWQLMGQALWNLVHKYGHFVLDVVGMAPVVGEWADVANAGWYYWEGDHVNGHLSLAGAVPVLGWFSTGAKWVGKAVFLADGTKVMLQLSKGANGIISFGSRSDLRKIWKITSKNVEAHHKIPWNLRENPVVQKAAEIGFHMNDMKNGIPLKKYSKNAATGDHANHPAYDKYVTAQLEKFMQNSGGINNISNEQAKDFVEKVLIPKMDDLIDKAKSYKGNLNDYFKNVVNPANGI